MRFAMPWVFSHGSKIARDDPREIIIIIINIIIFMYSYFHIKHGTISGHRAGNCTCVSAEWDVYWEIVIGT